MRSFIATILILSPWCLQAAELNQKLYRISEDITAASKVKYSTGTAIAVFPFQTEEKLSRKHVGLAVEEILTGNLIRTARFTVLERASLENVFKEQKLALSGAMESATAVTIGKMSGAKLLVLGSISNLGKNYQINARLVDAESGEVISAHYQEVPESAFNEDAARFIAIVPDAQKIGVYVAAVSAPGKVKKIAPFTASGITFVPTNKPSDMNGYGFGIRYWPSSRWMADFFFFSRLQDKSDRAFDMGNLAPGTERMLPYGKLYAKNGYRLILNRVFPGEKTNIYLGAGWQRYKMIFSALKGVGVSDMVSGAFMTPVTKSMELDMPIIRAGVEWRPQRRIGLAVLGGYSPDPLPLI